MKKFLLASVFASVSMPVFMLAGFSSVTAPAFWPRLLPLPAVTRAQSPSKILRSTTPTTMRLRKPLLKAKASASEAFLKQYPQSQVKKSVLEGLVDAYSAFDPAKTVDAAKRLLQVDPNNLKAMYLIAAAR